MTFQTDDLQELIFVRMGLLKQMEFEAHQVEWCNNNREEHDRRYRDMFTVEESIESHSSNLKKIESMIESLNVLINSMAMQKLASVQK